MKLVDYGYIWLMIYKEYVNQKHPYNNNYPNLSEMPTVPDDELFELFEVEKTVREKFEAIKHIELTFGNGMKKCYWKYADIKHKDKRYAYMVSDTGEDVEIYQVSPTNEGESYNLITDETTIDLLETLLETELKNK